MSDRSLNWLKFGGLVSLAFVLGLLFAGLLDLPRNSLAQGKDLPAIQTQAARPAANLRRHRHPGGALGCLRLGRRGGPAQRVLITSSRTEAAPSPQVPPGFEQFFPRGQL